MADTTYPCVHGDPCECANPTDGPAGGIPIGPDPIPTGRPDYVTGGWEDDPWEDDPLVEVSRGCWLRKSYLTEVPR